MPNDGSRLIAITGGIGAGKSVVSRILRCEGFKVYDCDLHAKALMDVDRDIHRKLCGLIHDNAVKDGVIDRKLLADIVFNDEQKLLILNSIVHEAVRKDLREWSMEHAGDGLLFVETAILYQSRLDEMVDEVWDVTAPLEVRIARVMRRNSFTREEVLLRIEKQDGYKPERQYEKVRSIVNDNQTPVLPQIKILLSSVV